MSRSERVAMGNRARKLAEEVYQEIKLINHMKKYSISIQKFKIWRFL